MIYGNFSQIWVFFQEFSIIQTPFTEGDIYNIGVQSITEQQKSFKNENCPGLFTMNGAYQWTCTVVCFVSLLW